MSCVGLTGSLAMGKSQTARMFAELGCPVFDADLEVHGSMPRAAATSPRLQRFSPPRWSMAPSIATGSPPCCSPTRPPCRRSRPSSIRWWARPKPASSRPPRRRSSLVILDIPLLFEVGRDSAMDRLVVVSAPAEVQRRRALARPGMTEEKLDRLLARQTSDAEKRAHADFMVDTSRGLDDAI